MFAISEKKKHMQLTSAERKRTADEQKRELADGRMRMFACQAEHEKKYENIFERALQISEFSENSKRVNHENHGAGYSQEKHEKTA